MPQKNRGRGIYGFIKELSPYRSEKGQGKPGASTKQDIESCSQPGNETSQLKEKRNVLLSTAVERNWLISAFLVVDSNSLRR